MTKQNLEMIQLGCLLVMAAYHILLYFQVKRHYYLYLGLLCFIVLVRATLVDDGTQLFFQIFPDAPKLLGRKIEYLVSYASLPLLPMFIYDLFSLRSFRKHLRFFQIMGVSLLGFVLVTPNSIYKYSLNAYHALMILAFVFVFVLLYYAMMKKRTGAMAIFIGLMVCFGFVFLEILKNSGVISIGTIGPNLVNTGVVSYLFFQSIALSTIFAKSFSENQLLNKELEEKVAARTEQLSKSNLVKDRFIQIVSHDLRSPLGNLKITVDLLQSGGLNPADSKKLLLGINKRVDQSLGMLDDLLLWSKVSTSREMEQESFVMNDLVQEVISLHEFSAAKKDINLRFIFREILSIDTDKNATKVILRNLLSNAIKFTPRGGVVSVLLDKSEGQVRLKVVDSGIGVPDEMKVTLFDLDRRNNRSGTEQEESSGVGLALCKDLITQNNGRITVSDNPAESGTIFTCWFPRRD